MPQTLFIMKLYMKLFYTTFFLLRLTTVITITVPLILQGNKPIRLALESAGNLLIVAHFLVNIVNLRHKR